MLSLTDCIMRACPALVSPITFCGHDPDVNISKTMRSHTKTRQAVRHVEKRRFRHNLSSVSKPIRLLAQPGRSVNSSSPAVRHVPAILIAKSVRYSGAEPLSHRDFKHEAPDFFPCPQQEQNRPPHSRHSRRDSRVAVSAAERHRTNSAWPTGLRPPRPLRRINLRLHDYDTISRYAMPHRSAATAVCGARDNRKAEVSRSTCQNGFLSRLRGNTCCQYSPAIYKAVCRWFHPTNIDKEI